VSLPPFPVVAATDGKAPPPKPATPSRALPAKHNANGEESLTRVLGLKLGRVVIDPGHGGHDEGTHGPTGLTEKEVVLDIAKRLGALLEQRLSTEVVYTRNDDTFIPLEDRTRIANEHKADLFLSIHANSSPVRSVSGVESYYLNFTTSQTALDVAARENATAQSSIFDLQQVLQKIAVKDKIDESREFATRIQSALFSISAKTNSAARNRGVKKAPFVVLIGASMPSVLAEIGFLTNSSDEALLRNPAHRQKIADALFKGIASYADTLSHFTVAQRE
jgi:N-acetylmuramoyl-L-alanine amidase